MDIVISKHGKDRLKLRLGLKRKSLERHIKKVLVNGKAFFGFFNEKNKFYLIYNSFFYLFALEQNQKLVLVTVLTQDMYEKQMPKSGNRIFNFSFSHL